MATFDGNGHVIANLLVNRDRVYAGLFAAMSEDATVHSLGLPNVRVNAGSIVGALAGWNEGRIAATWTSGTVEGDGSVGGLVGSTMSRWRR